MYLKSRDSQESFPIPQFKSINSSALSFLYSPPLTSIHSVASSNHLSLFCEKNPSTAHTRQHICPFCSWWTSMPLHFTPPPIHSSPTLSVWRALAPQALPLMTAFQHIHNGPPAPTQLCSCQHLLASLLSGASTVRLQLPDGSQPVLPSGCRWGSWRVAVDGGGAALGPQTFWGGCLNSITAAFRAV